jgi:tellurite resistance protein TerC
VVLVLVGAKMLLTDVVEVPVGISLGAIAVVLTAAVVASLAWPERAAPPGPSGHEPPEPPAPPELPG